MPSNTSSVAVAAEPALTSAERDRARLFLEQAQNEVLGALRGITDAQWTFKPEPGVWSVADNMEHIIIVQERILGPVRDRLAAAPCPAADRDCQAVDQIVMDRFPNRLTKFQGPESVHPNGGLALSEAVGRVAENTRRFIDYLESTNDLRQHAIESAPLKAMTRGEHEFMDGYQWILAVAAHTERHVKQILEVKAHPNFPAN
jgi:hypothetical protein